MGLLSIRYIKNFMREMRRLHFLVVIFGYHVSFSSRFAAFNPLIAGIVSHSCQRALLMRRVNRF